MFTFNFIYISIRYEFILLLYQQQLSVNTIIEIYKDGNSVSRSAAVS